MMNPENCAVCHEKAEQLCGKCQVVRYCSRDHQIAHWKTHKSRCFPCKVESNEALGRYLVASRDIRKGELIFSDPPIMTGPIGMCKPACLGCMGYTDGSFKCDKCGWPLCSPSCQGIQNHIPECELAQRNKITVNIANPDIPHPLYHCVAPLRCLWMKQNDPEKWQKLNEMEDHLEERKKTDSFRKAQNYVVNIIRGFLKLEEFGEEEIQKVCGVLEVNGYEVPRSSSVSLYSFGYLMEHSCIANTSRTFSPNLDLIVRAAVDIQKGQNLQTCYVDALKGERIRKAQLQVYKYFMCSCLRCKDPTDLETHFSSVKCQNCSNGLLPPPREIEEPYRCNVCNSKRDALEIEKQFVKEYERLNTMDNSIVAKEKYLKETQRFLSENHHFRVEVKLQLLQMYGKMHETGLKGISSSDLERKRQLCQEVLELANLFVPGLSRLRGIILYELQSVYYEKFLRLHKKKKQTEEGLLLLQQIEAILSEALQILQMENHIQEEIQMALEAEHQLQLIKQKLSGKINK